MNAERVQENPDEAVRPAPARLVREPPGDLALLYQPFVRLIPLDELRPE